MNICLWHQQLQTCWEIDCICEQVQELSHRSDKSNKTAAFELFVELMLTFISFFRTDYLLLLFMLLLLFFTTLSTCASCEFLRMHSKLYQDELCCLLDSHLGARWAGTQNHQRQHSSLEKCHCSLWLIKLLWHLW